MMSNVTLMSFLILVLKVCSRALSIQFHLTTDDTITTGMAMNRLYLATDSVSMVVLCQLYDPDNDTENSRIQLFTEYTSLGLSPLITISNATSSREFRFELATELHAWKLNISRFDLTGEERAGTSSYAQWDATVYTANSLHLFSTYATVIDLLTEPLWRRKFPNLVSSPPAEVFDGADGVKVVSSPCSPDVAAILLQTSAAHPGVYLAVTRGAFAAGSTYWYDLSPSLSDTCRDATKQDCSGLRLVDGVLSNRHLLLLSDRGVFVSESLMQGASGSTLAFTYVNTFHGTSLSQAFQNEGDHFQMSHTQFCMDRQHEVYTRDLVAVLYTGATDHSWQVEDGAVYSFAPFTTWVPVYTAETAPAQLQAVLSVQHNHHRDAVTLLYQTNEGKRHVAVRQLDSVGNLSKKVFFPPFSFPDGSLISTLTFNPTSNDLYATGSEVWLSLDGGNFFEKLHPQNGSSIASIAMSRNDNSIVLETSLGVLLYGKTGIPRLAVLQDIAPASPLHHLYIRHCGAIYQLTVTSGSISSTLINITRLEHTDVSFARALVPQYITEDDLLLHEYASLEPADTDPASGFLPTFTGKLLSLRQGGAALVTEVRHWHSVPGYVSALRMFVLKPFTYESLQDSPAQAYTLLAELPSPDSNYSQLILQDVTGAGWQETDVGKSVVLPSYSFLVVERVNDTHSIGAPVMHLRVALTAREGQWFMYNIGLTTLTPGERPWMLTEDRCRHRLFVDDVLRRRQLFELDAKENASFSVAARIWGAGPAQSLAPATVCH
ncbi:PREDICTED: cation channel sperm-associated protein subunit beta-like [Priapulus caudatus]|uniref:Cation channel sperm-associated protein subunit beta-like n=1 Tax=Priapulus caudatus TaxID=37621 RepID=A0ABM1E630_PRICU|nr:PREDICTED: cation channel sperm-associated protein subunit beta-like [Priapulus caudatus]